MLVAFKNLAEMSSRNVYDFWCEQKAVVWLRAVYQQVFRFIVLEVKMPSNCTPKAKSIQSRVRQQNNCPSFGAKSTSSRIPTEQASFVSIYTVSIKHRLRTEDWA